MYKRKTLFVTVFGIFSLFFGAGNLLIPPLLGYNAGEQWFGVTIGFIFTAVAIPIIGIMAHARLQGTMYDFGKKVSPWFSSIYCIIVYVISVAIPSPRTASATHEIAIHPAFGTDPFWTSLVYFALVLVFVLNRSKILNIIGKFLTPLIVIMLLLVIGIGLYNSSLANPATLDTPIVSAILEGYQTFDAIGAVVVGAFIIVSLKFKTIDVEAYEAKKSLIRKAGLIAGLGLFVIYAGLISVGAYYGTEISVDTTLDNDMQRANLLRSISISALGTFGNTVLSVLISLACFTTAVGIVAGTSDYFRNLFSSSNKVYIITAIIACIAGVGVGQLDFYSIIVIAYPVLLFIYPITIALIILNVLPQRLATPLVFRTVVISTFIFSIPDVIGAIEPIKHLKDNFMFIPLVKHSFGWILPALLVFVLVNICQKSKPHSSS